MNQIDERAAFTISFLSTLSQFGGSADRVQQAARFFGNRWAESATTLTDPNSMTLFWKPKGAAAESTIQKALTSPGLNIAGLIALDRIGHQVLANERDVSYGIKEIETLVNSPPLYSSKLRILACGLLSLGVSSGLSLDLFTLLASLVMGFLVGYLIELSDSKPNLGPLIETICGFLAAVGAALCSFFFIGFEKDAVILGSLVVLFPGLAMTVAMRELATNHVISGVGRLAGAFTTLLKLVVGVLFGQAVSTSLGKTLGNAELFQLEISLPIGIDWMTLPITAFAFSILFRIPLKLYASVFLFVALAQLSLQSLTGMSSYSRVFIAALLIGFLSNVIAWWKTRPSSITLIPGLIMMVPGGLGYRGLLKIGENSSISGFQTLAEAIILTVALASGILFSQYLTPQRKVKNEPLTKATPAS